MNPYRNRDLGSEYQSGIIDATKGLGQFLFDQTLLSPQHPYNRFSKRISEVGLLDEDPVMDEIVDEIGLNTIGMGGVLKAIRPVRQNQLSQLGLLDNPGGRYMSPDLKEDLTGKTFQGMNISTKGGKRSMLVDDENLTRSVVPENKPGNLTAQEKADAKLGKIVKVNLMDSKRSKWEWTDPEGNPVTPPDPADTLVSVHDNNAHYYTLDAKYDTPVTLKTYPREKSEPRLKPTTRGDVDLSNSTIIGYAKKGKNVRPVYDQVKIIPRSITNGLIGKD